MKHSPDFKASAWDAQLEQDFLTPIEGSTFDIEVKAKEFLKLMHSSDVANGDISDYVSSKLQFETIKAENVRTDGQKRRVALLQSMQRNIAN